MRDGRDLVVVVVLSHHGEAVFDGGRGDQRIGELDHPLDAGRAAVDHQSRPGADDGLTDRDRIGRPGEGECVRPPDPSRSVVGAEDSTWSAPIVTTDTATRPGSSPRGRFASKAMKTEESSSSAGPLLPVHRWCRRPGRRGRPARAGSAERWLSSSLRIRHCLQAHTCKELSQVIWHGAFVTTDPAVLGKPPSEAGGRLDVLRPPGLATRYGKDPIGNVMVEARMTLSNLRIPEPDFGDVPK